MATPEITNDKTPPLSELGGTGLRNYSGYFNEDEVVKDLQWPYSINRYREMEADALIAGALFAIKQFIRSAEWEVEEYKGENAPSDTRDQADFLRSCLKDLDKPWEETMIDILSFLTYGFSLHEIVYKKRLGMNQSSKKYRSKYNDGLYGWRKFPIRAQDTLEFNKKCFDSDGEIYRVHQKDLIAGIDTYIPEERYLLFRTTSYKDNPYGRSILYAAYRSYYFRKNIEVVEAIGIERNLAGIPIIRIPSELMSPDADEGQQKLRRMYEVMGQMIKKNDQSYVLLPSDTQDANDSGNGKYHYDIELLRSDGSNNSNQGPVIERWDRRIMQSMLADFLLVGGQSVGSYALSSTKVDAFKTAISSYLDTIAAQFNEKAIPMLWEINGWDSTKCPKLKHTGIDKIDTGVIADFIKKTIEVGAITPDQNVEEYLRNSVGLKPYQHDGNGGAVERARQQAEISQGNDINTNQNNSQNQQQGG